MERTRRNSIPDDDSQLGKPRVKGKKLVVLTVLLMIIIFVVAQILYIYVIPRVTIDTKTIYHEATGGGGTGGIINVNSKFINSGTMDVDNFAITVSLLNKTKDILITETYEQNIVKPKDEHEVKLVTNGNCFETFYIIVEIQFETGKNEYSKKYLYETHEAAMNIGYEDSIFDWGF